MVFVWASGRKGRALAGEWDRVRLGVLEERQGWGVGPLANKVWVQLESLAGSAPRPCGHKQQQSGRRSRARMQSEARGDDRGPGVGIPGADVGQRWSR